MKNRTKKVVFIAVFFIILWMAFSPTANAQTPTPPTRDILILEIQQRAQKDVELGTPPQSPSDLAVLFSEQALIVGMTMSEVKDIYDDAYKAAMPEKTFWQKLQPEGGIILFLAGALLVIVGNIAKDYLTTLFKKLAEHAYQRLARFRPFWMIALRRYRQSLEKTYCELKIPFRAGRPLQMQDVYVPVRVDGGDKKQVDAYQTIQNKKRLVVLGDPGSGKTMLLRHVAFTYARQGLDDFDGRPIPVFLELNRVESAGDDLFKALTKTLENHNFPGAEGFLKSALENHSLLILLDGLDEVNAAARPALVKQIEDLWQKHPNNRIIVTCRRAVYQGELDAWVDAKLEIIEFSDQQIQRFMTSWQKDMPAEKSIEHFFRTLQERPQIMTLARNPLLLTMVAYLYTDTEFALPHSRSEFYSRSTDLLLDQWKLERNRYKASHKRTVLQRLALFNQSQAGQTGERRTLELADVLREIRAVLPDLTLKTEDAQPLLDEIVQRSGLMLAIDGGTRYQFTHLTLQEYFAARALEADQKRLLDFYRATPDAWREVVRLWCALEHDSTSMLKELHALDPVMAFECLSDAQQVDNAYTDELIESFKPSLSEEIDSASLSSTFAMLAADPRPRGRRWFEFIKSNLDIKQNRLAACAILAQTNIPQAAEPLVKLAATDSSVIPFIVQLGNLAVPALTGPAQSGEEWAMNALVDIGTPQAALALEPLLWPRVAITEKETFREPITYHYEETTREMYQAAWYLAALLPLAGIEDALKTVNLPTDYRKAKQIEWVWEPFSDNANLQAIAGRIAYLIDTTLEEHLPGKSLPCDPRLALSICGVVKNVYWNLDEDNRQKIHEQIADTKKSLPTLENLELHQPKLENEKQKVITDECLEQLSKNRALQRMYSALSIVTQFDLLYRLVTRQEYPTEDDWRNLFKPVSYDFSKSWHVKLIKILFIFAALLNLAGIYAYLQLPIFSWVNIVAVASGIVLIISVAKATLATWEYFTIRGVLYHAIVFMGLAIGVIIKDTTGNWFTGMLIGTLSGGLGGLLGNMAGKNSLWRDMFQVNDILTGMIAGLLGGALGSVMGVTICMIVGVGSVKRRLAGYKNMDRNRMNTVGYVLGSWSAGTYFSALTLLSTYFASLFLYDQMTIIPVILFWLMWFGSVFILVFVARHLERRAQNPLRGLLEESPAANVVTNKRMTMVARLLRWRG